MSADEVASRPPRRQSMLRRTFGRASTAFGKAAPQVSRYHDHFSLQAPTSIVRFEDSKSAARVIYNGNSQLVLEEHYNRENGKRNVTIKQMAEESGGALQLLRAMYTIVGFFFAGFLVAFSINLIMFIVLDLSIALGYTNLQKADYSLAVGVLLAFPLMIHGLSVVMMLAGKFVVDLWKGHYLFKKFVLPSVSDLFVEWLFLVGFLIAPLVFMGACLMAQTDQWWEYTALFWFSSIFFFYAGFLFSVFWYEALIYFSVVHAAEHETTWGRLSACVLLAKKHALSGYTRTTYSSFGSPEAALSADASASRKYVVQGTLRENQRSMYTRLSQWSCLHGVLYEKLDDPERIYSVDDIIERRPYITSFSWNLEKYFCKPRKTRYIGILSGPGAITSTQIKSTIACAFLGVFVVYFLVASILVYNGFDAKGVWALLAVICLLSFPFLLSPFRLMKELAKIRVLKQELKRRDGVIAVDKSQVATDGLDQIKAENNPSPPDGMDDLNSEKDEEEVQPINGSASVKGVTSGANDGEGMEHTISELGDDAPSDKKVGFAEHVIKSFEEVLHPSESTTKSSSLEWSGFSKDKNDFSRGVYHVAERYRVTQPTNAFSWVILILEVVFLILWPTILLYALESWQLATVYFILAASSAFRHLTNAEVMLMETGQLHTPDSDADDATTWQLQSRLSQVAATLTRGRAYQAWRFIFWVFTLILIVLGVQSINTDVQNTSTSSFTVIDDFHYEQINSLHYSACEFTKNIEGNIATTMADYAFLSSMAYQTTNSTRYSLDTWFGPNRVADRTDDIVAGFRNSQETSRAVSYKLFTGVGDEGESAIISIRGSQNARDFLADGQLWGSAVLMQGVRAFLPFGEMWTPILDQMIVLLGALQSGTIDRLSFYRSTTGFAEYLRDSGNYTSIVITGHSLGGGLGIISGAQAGIQAVAISGPNALLSRHRFGITAEDLERYTFNVMPDRDLVAMIDDPVKNVQRIECRAPKNSLFGCHSVSRSFCEVIYTCGTDKPTICECATLYGYPEPIPRDNTTRTFTEACGEKETPI